MSTQFKNPAEAFAALATVTVAADQVCTMQERRTLFEQTRHLDVFQDLDQAAFARLLEDTVESVYSTLPWDESSVTPQGIAALVEAARAVLSPELRGEAFGMALGLARADQLCDQELALLDQLRRGLVTETL
jgi:DNA phosphorothioation-dependent restriction protein DptG